MEVYQRKTRSRVRDGSPSVTVLKRGGILLNRAAMSLVGNTKYVLLGFDTVKRQLVLVPKRKHGDGARVLSRVNKGSNGVIHIRGSLAFFGLTMEPGQQYEFGKVKDKRYFYIRL